MRTAVEIFMESLGLTIDSKIERCNELGEKEIVSVSEELEKAKAMEKAQIINAASWTPEDGLSILSELSEQYYNETFKSE